MVDSAGAIRDLLVRLVGCESVNPAFRTGGRPGSGEAGIAELVAGLFYERGLEVTSHEAAPGRTSVVGVRRGSGGGRRLMLNGHLDTVGTDGMREPFAARVEGGRLYGRGAYDMKGGLAAALAALALVDGGTPLGGDLLLAFVADEEDASLGTAQIAELHRVDGAIVLEPTELRLCIAHKGFVWARLVTEGFACHGSDVEHGVDANLRMGAVLVELARLEAELRQRTTHPLLGPPSLHAPQLEGGVGPSIYAPRCVVQVERRTLPGETPAQVVAELAAAARSAAATSGFPVPAVEEVLSRSPFEGSPQGALAVALRTASHAATGTEPETAGVPFWTDAALLAAAGADVVLFGPAGGGAHEAEEWVDLDSVARCARILAETARRYCG